MAIGGIIAAIVNASDKGRDGKRYLKQALQGWEDLPLPEFEKLIAPYLQSIGQLTPEIYDVIEKGSFRGIQEDPGAQEAQLRNIGRMEQMAQQGLPLQDRLMMQESQRGLAQEGSRAREAVIANMARRGRGGSGSELAARLATTGAQEEAARGRGSDLAQMSLQNRVAAMGQLGGELGAYRGQNIGKEAQISQMQNRYNEFFSNLNTQGAANAARQRGLAQQYNLGEGQRIADANVMGTYGASQDRNQLQRDLFQAGAQKQGGITSAFGGLSNMANARLAQRQQRVSGAGQGVDSLINTVIGAKLGKKPGGGG